MSTLTLAVRVDPIKSLDRARYGLGASEDHGKRADAVSQRRVVRDATPIAWSKAGPDRELELIEAFKLHKQEIGAAERGGAAIGMHIIVAVSPLWMSEGGADPFDSANPRVQRLVAEARAWAESWCGEGSCFACRYDQDEKGSGVVDVFVAPTALQKRRSGKQVCTISIASAKERLAKKHGERLSGAAMQTDWHNWATARLDTRFVRGKRKEETGREHVHAEVYARVAEETKAQVAVEAHDWRAAAQAEVEAERESLLAQARTEAQSERDRLAALPFTIPDIPTPSLTDRLSGEAFKSAVAASLREPLQIAAAKAAAFDTERKAREEADRRAAEDRARAKAAMNEANTIGHARAVADDKARKATAEQARLNRALAAAETERDAWREKAEAVPDFLPLSEIAAQLGMKRQTATEWQDGSTGRKFTIIGNTWEDHGGKAKGVGAVMFVARVLKKTLVDAMAWLLERWSRHEVMADAAAASVHLANRAEGRLAAQAAARSARDYGSPSCP